MNFKIKNEYHDGGPFEIAENSFDCLEIGKCRLMKMLANLIYGMSDVWVSESEVLKCSHDASILSFINWGMIYKLSGLFNGNRGRKM